MACLAVGIACHCLQKSGEEERPLRSPANGQRDEDDDDDMDDDIDDANAERVENGMPEEESSYVKIANSLARAASYDDTRLGLQAQQAAAPPVYLD